MRTFNVFEATTEYDATDPEGYHAGMNRFGAALGASRVGASLYELPPGQSICPYHYESEEEWVMVLQGQLSVRHPEGESVLGPGEVAVFPAHAAGAHKTTNRGDETVRLLMLSTKGEVEYSVYPDSNKVGLFTTDEIGERVLVRRGESLDYYDGEV